MYTGKPSAAMRICAALEAGDKDKRQLRAALPGVSACAIKAALSRLDNRGFVRWTGRENAYFHARAPLKVWQLVRPFDEEAYRRVDREALRQQRQKRMAT